MSHGDYEWCPSVDPGDDGCCAACGYVPGKLTRRGLVRTHHTRDRLATLDGTGDAWERAAVAGAVIGVGDATLAVVHAVADLGLAAMERGRLPIGTAVQFLAAMTDARTDLARVEATIEAHIVSLWREQGRGRTMLEVEGAGVVEVKRTVDRKRWDHAALAAAVIDAHLDGGTGEQPTPWEVRDWLMEAAAPSYWRVGALRAVGLRPGDYCSELPGRDTVRLTR